MRVEVVDGEGAPLEGGGAWLTSGVDVVWCCSRWFRSNKEEGEWDERWSETTTTDEDDEVVMFVARIRTRK
jgi:hypothetical protein